MLFSQRPKSYIVFSLDPCRGCAGLTASVMAFMAEFWTFIMLTAASSRNKDTRRLKQHEMQCWNPHVEHSQVVHRMAFTMPRVLWVLAGKASQLHPSLEKGLERQKWLEGCVSPISLLSMDDWQVARYLQERQPCDAINTPELPGKSVSLHFR